MRIIIAGAGEVGFHLAKHLASENFDIYIIDYDANRLKYIQSKIDIFAIQGDAKDVKKLREAKIKSADLLIAATSSEETNLVVCTLAKKIGVKQTIARVNNYELITPEVREIYREIGVDTIISPVELAYEEIVRLVEESAIAEEFEFENGVLSVFGITIEKGSKLCDTKVGEVPYFENNRDYKPIAILRKETIIMISPDTQILSDDLIYFISVPQKTKEIAEICGHEVFKIKNIMILGGSKIGVLTAELLESKYNVTLLESNRERATEIASALKKTLVINLDGTDVANLESENIQDMDAFIAVTGDSEVNIISCLVAKYHGVKKTISSVENVDYINLSHNIGVDTLINKKVLAAGSIFRYVRKGEIKAVAKLQWTNAEIIDFQITDKNSKALRGNLSDLKIPAGATIAGVVRNEKGFVPNHDFQFQIGDKAIVFCCKNTIKAVESFFI